MVRVKKIVAIQDSGLILDRSTWNSQVYGGVIMGLNYGLFEERIMDPETGVMLNADLELYKLAGASDIPEIIVGAYDPPRSKGAWRDRRGRTPDDRDRGRHCQRGDQRHRRAGSRMADVSPKRTERPGRSFPRREGLTPHECF